jgi:4-alpha-glucanotransferase
VIQVALSGGSRVRFPRRSGILLHPTSLPGRYGIGDLGHEAYRFADFLVAAQQSLWQVLPLGPAGYGDSPYQCLSAFAGNPLLISPDLLVADQLLTPAEVRDVPSFPAEKLAFGAVIPFKYELLTRAAGRLASGTHRELSDAFAMFRATHAAWLDDFALFMALKVAHQGAAWNTWEPDIARRTPEALARWRQRLAETVSCQQALQFLFFRQWLALKHYANARGIRIVGEVPIFVAHDSNDVWSHPELFLLDNHGAPTVVAGVPPDAFSASGQRWGNPLYRWDVMAQQDFAWWIERLRAQLSLSDLVRIDHFIGFTRCWAVPASETTASHGRWIAGPGAAMALAVRRELGGLPVIAEDLGLLTPEAEALRDRFDLPGMEVLQFAFGGDASNRFLPHHYRPNCVVYTGTHDNDTTVGWFQSAPPQERSFAQRYLARSGEDIAYDLIRAAMSSVADTVIVPLQDILMLGSEARMNHPGRPDGNWSWRFRPEMLGAWHRSRLREMTELYDRPPGNEVQRQVSPCGASAEEA